MKKHLDIEIIKSFKEGSEEAFAKIYEYYFNRILFFAYNHVNNIELAQDIVQNTFLSVYRSIGNINHIEAFHVWIMKIAYCECQNIYRKNKIKSVTLPEHMDIDSMEDEKKLTMDEHMENIELQEVVSNEIKTMHYKLKDVAVLKYVEGLSEKEISQVLKIPKGTVKSRAYKAKMILRDSLKRNGITPSTYRSYGFTIPTIFMAGFVYMQEQATVVKPSYESIISLAKTTGVASSAIVSGIRSATIKKVAATGGVALTSIAVASVFLFSGSESTKFALNMDVKAKTNFVPQNCEIEDIVYDTSYTSGNITLDVKLSNDVYDQITVNGNPSLEITENGDYVVRVLRDETVIDEKTISIHNIDREPPEFLHYENDGNTYTIFMNDAISKIHPSMIKYYKNGILSNDFIFDSNTQTLQFTYEDFSSNVFEFYDHAGNSVEVVVTSKKI